MPHPVSRRSFLTTLAAIPLACAPGTRGAASLQSTDGRRLKRVGVQLYSLRDDARRDLERTLANIAEVGYTDVELLGSMNNFGMPPARLRQLLDTNGLRAPSTHVGGNALDDLDRQLDDARTLGHEYLVVASLPVQGKPTLDDYRRWADRLNDAGALARRRGVWVGFHNHAGDHAPIDGQSPYDLLVARTQPELVRLQLDTGNTAMGGHDPLDYLRRFGPRYWSFHIKDVPRLRATADTELGTGIVKLRELLAGIDRIDEKLLFVEQETYPGAPLDSVRRDFQFISTLTF